MKESGLTRKLPSILLSVLLLLASVGCANQHAGNVRDGQTIESAESRAVPAAFGFEDTAALLAERGIVLKPIPENEREGLLTEDVFRQRLDEIMEEHSHWGVLSVHLGSVDVPDGHFNISNQPTYVVEITGPATGNCFDLYLATNGHPELGTCFYPTRP